METILFQYLKYPFHWKQFLHLLEIYFKRILYYSQWQRIFSLLETIFFQSDFFGNHYCNQREANIFKNILISATLEEPFSSVFFQILTQMETAFRFSEIAFFKESFILASGNGFSINYKLCAFIRSFFLLVDAMLEISCKPVFFHFSIPNSRSSFSGQWKRISYRMLHSSEWKRIFCLVFFYSDLMLWQWRPLLKLR